MDSIGKVTIDLISQLIKKKGLKKLVFNQVKIKETDHFENMFRIFSNEGRNIQL